MAQAALGGGPSADTGSLTFPERSEVAKPPHTTNVHPTGDSASDGDAGERPVREKLKKTSIASMPKYGIISAENQAEAPVDIVMASQETEDDQAPEHQLPSADVEPRTSGVEDRGRAVRKRSLEDLDAADMSNHISTETAIGAHARKRSRDVRSGKHIKSESRQRSPQNSVREENEEFESGKEARALREDLEETKIKESTPTSGPEFADHEMQESVLSPKKKRSRDNFEADVQREQKIAATEENRARRRSSEEERRAMGQNEKTEGISEEQSLQNGHAIAPKDNTSKDPTDTSTTKVPLPSGFSSYSTISPFTTVSSGNSVFGGAPTSSSSTTTQQKQIPSSTSAFDSSGFAKLAGSSGPPFSSIGTESATSPPTNLSTSPQERAKSPFPSTTTTQLSGFGALAGSGSGGFGSSKGFSVASSGASAFGGTLGGSAFGGGFSAGFGGGSKLSSFAAPTGDAKLGTSKVKAFGASASDDEGSGSNDGGSSAGDGGDEQEEEPSRSKFHLQEVDTGEEGEESIFQTRAKLFVYQHDEKKWAERGLGMFKLNVTRKNPAEDNQDDSSKAHARFIMRTFATHKVILNAPVFKEMNMGDNQGKEPTGRAVVFSVPVDGKLVPHTLRMSKDEETKTLYREVRKLQKDM